MTPSKSHDAWREIALEDIAKEITVGHVGPMVSEYVSSGIPFLRSQNVEPLRINQNDIKFITPEFHARIAKSALSPGDVVIVRTGKPGSCAVVPDWLPVSNCSDLVIVRCGEQLDANFLSYYVNTVAAHHVSAHLVGAVQQHFNVGSARKLKMILPEIEEQRAIASVLGALDEKIELNRRMNETLEALAQTLFKSWFVDAAKNGHPKGWRSLKWGDLVSLEYGKALSSYEGDAGSFPVFGTNGKIGTHSTPLCNHAGIVIGRKGAYRGVHFSNLPFYVIDTAFYVEPKKEIELRWAYYDLLRLDMNGMDSGSAIPSTSRADFYNLPVLLPPFALQQRFVELLNPCWARQEHNKKESHTLAALRDTLLPKLLSGELRVGIDNSQKEAVYG